MTDTGAPAGRERLAQLEEELARMTALLPEHCGGREQYVDNHRASIKHWQMIEDLEAEIAALKAELAKR